MHVTKISKFCNARELINRVSRASRCACVSVLVMVCPSIAMRTRVRVRISTEIRPHRRTSDDIILPSLAGPTSSPQRHKATGCGAVLVRYSEGHDPLQASQPPPKEPSPLRQSPGIWENPPFGRNLCK